MLNAVQKTSWYLFVFLLPWQTAWVFHEVFVGGEKWQYATGLLFVSDIALAISAVALLLGAGHDLFRRVIRDGVFWAFASLFILSLCSEMWAARPDMAMEASGRLLVLLAVYLVARFGGVSVRWTVVVFIVAMGFHAIFAVSQWDGQYVSSPKWLGISEHDPAQPGTAVVKSDSGRYLRAYGGFEHPNVFAGALAWAAIAGLFVIARERNGVVRAFLLASLPILMLALAVSFSRTGWVMFSVGVMAFGALSLMRRFGFGADRGTAARTVLAGFLAFFALGAFLLMLRSVTGDRFSTETIGREGSISDREAYMRQAVFAIRKNPIFGVGAGNFTAFSLRVFPEAGSFIGAFQPVHVVPVLVFAELGIVGFALFAFALAYGFARAWAERNLLVVVGLSALVPSLLLDHWLWTGHFGTALLGMILGLSARGSEASRDSGEENQPGVEMPEARISSRYSKWALSTVWSRVFLRRG